MNNIEELKIYLVEGINEKYKLSKQTVKAILIILNSDLQEMLDECKPFDQSILNFSKDILSTVASNLSELGSPAGTYREIEDE